MTDIAKERDDGLEIARLLLVCGLDLAKLQGLTGLHRARLGRLRSASDDPTSEEEALIRTALEGPPQ